MRRTGSIVSSYAEVYVCQAMLVLKTAWDRGVTTIDTANIYSNGESERIIGRFIKKVQRSPSAVSSR